MKVLTIGHSNQTLESFLELLTDNGIEVLVDIRCQPYSKYSNQFNARNLKDSLPDLNIKYPYLGKELGGKPDEPRFYDQKRRALYDELAKTEPFIQGVERLKSGIEKFRVAIMCSEEDPTDCHRKLLIGEVLSKAGVQNHHIRGDGRVQTDEELEEEHAKRR